MKKILPILMAVLLLFLAACGVSGDGVTTAAPDVSGVTTGTPASETAASTTEAAPVQWKASDSPALPVDLIGCTVARADELLGQSGSGLPCADGGWLRDWSDAMGKVEFSTHEEEETDGSLIQTLYCAEPDRTVAPGLKTGLLYEDYKEAFPGLTDCAYDPGCGYFICGFEATTGGDPLHVQLCFFTPDEVCTGIIISTRELGAGMPAVAQDERDKYPVFQLNRSFAQALAQFGAYVPEIGDDYDTPQAKALVLADDVETPAKAAPGEAAHVKLLYFYTDELPILPGIFCGMDAMTIGALIGDHLPEDSVLKNGTMAEIRAEMEEYDSIYCGTYRIGTMNAECHATFDADGALASWGFLVKALY